MSYHDIEDLTGKVKRQYALKEEIANIEHALCNPKLGPMESEKLLTAMMHKTCEFLYKGKYIARQDIASFEERVEQAIKYPNQTLQKLLE